MRVFRIETIGGELAIEMQYIDGIPLSAVLTDLLPGIHGSVTMNPKFMAAPRGFYFLALSDSVAGQQLFYYDHDRVQVRHIADVSEVTSARAVLGNALILSSNDPDHGMEPRIQRSESVGIERLADLYPGSVSSAPNHFFRSGKKVYFAARTEATASELWVTDGIVGGTVPLADINPGPEGNDVHAFVDGGERGYVRATTKARGKELWMSDGTPEGVQIVVDAWPGQNITSEFLIKAGPYSPSRVQGPVQRWPRWIAAWSREPSRLPSCLIHASRVLTPAPEVTPPPRLENRHRSYP